MRGRAAGALLIALAALAICVPSASARAWIAFLPAGDYETRPLLDELAARGMAIGMTSPTVGGFKKRQMALDIGQGTRIPTRLYSGPIGSLRWTGDRLRGWSLARGRAADAPGDVRPGLLASTVKRAGGQVGWAGAVGPFVPGAVVAADERGRVERAHVDDALTVLDLPAGRAGLRTLDRLLAERGEDDLVYVVRAPSGDELRLLPSGVAATGVEGRLRSNTTRRNGLIAATDVAPTVLRALGIEVPGEMQGQVIEGQDDPDPAAIRAMAERLDVVTDRRGITLVWLVGGWLVLMLALWAAARVNADGRTDAGSRIGLLAVLWMPGLALGTAALEPSRMGEAAAIGVGSLALGALTDRLVRWPFAPAIPATVVFIAHAIDLARGSPLIGTSLVGPNPAGGARFFGVGNELEILLSLAVLIGAGAALARAEPPPRRAALFAALVAVAALVMGAGRLGADVGAVITLGAGGAAGVVAALTRAPSRRIVAIAVAAPVAAVVLLVLVDLATGGGAHLSRSVLGAGESGDLVDVAERRFEGSLSSLGKPGWVVAVVLAVTALAWLAARRERLLEGVPDGFRAGLIGAWFAVLIGALANDSGPQIVVVGALVVLLGAAYANRGLPPIPTGRVRS